MQCTMRKDGKCSVNREIMVSAVYIEEVMASAV